MLQEGPDYSHVSQLGRAAQGFDRQFRNGARLQQQGHQFAVPTNGCAVQGSLALLLKHVHARYQGGKKAHACVP